jgi:hypothetical protein
MGTPNSMRVMYITSFLTESGFLEAYDELMYCLIYSHFLSSIWWMQKIWSIVDLLHWNLHCWSPIISSIYGLYLERRIFNKILYEVDSSDIPW